MGNAILLQFPGLRFERRLIPFITTEEEALSAVAEVDEAMRGPVAPLVFATAARDDIRRVLHTSTAPIIDFFGMHLARVEELLGVRGERIASRLHGVGDVQRYNARM